MKKIANLCKKEIVVLMAAILAAGLTGCTTKELCLYPGCDNEGIDGTGACYKHVSNSSSNKSSYNAKKYDTYDVYDYDDPDDFASDFAYDEFGKDSWEAYEYGYEEAYDYWMDEMGE